MHERNSPQQLEVDHHKSSRGIIVKHRYPDL